MDIYSKKSELRDFARKKRANLSPLENETCSQAICQHIENFAPLTLKPISSVISGFWPLKGEIDVTPLLARLAEQGHAVCLPVVRQKEAPLLFRRWYPGDDLIPAGMGLQVPHHEAEELCPSILIVPLLTFDRQGNRLGYGGGFYDRTLEFLRGRGEAYAIGVAHSFQEVESVPVDAEDQRLDAISTEKEFIKFD